MAKKAKKKSSKTQRNYLLPNGKITTSYRTYSRAWRKLAKPIERITQSKCISYDPDLVFMTADKYTFNMGSYEAGLISSAPRKKDK